MQLDVLAFTDVSLGWSGDILQPDVLAFTDVSSGWSGDILRPDVLVFTDVFQRNGVSCIRAPKSPDQFIFHSFFLGTEPELELLEELELELELELLGDGDALPDFSIFSPLLRYVTCQTDRSDQGRKSMSMCAALPSV